MSNEANEYQRRFQAAKEALSVLLSRKQNLTVNRKEALVCLEKIDANLTDVSEEIEFAEMRVARYTSGPLTPAPE